MRLPVVVVELLFEFRQDAPFVRPRRYKNGGVLIAAPRGDVPLQARQDHHIGVCPASGLDGFGILGRGGVKVFVRVVGNGQNVTSESRRPISDFSYRMGPIRELRMDMHLRLDPLPRPNPIDLANKPCPRQPRTTTTPC